MTLVGTNILLDFITEDPVWLEPSRAAFAARAAVGPLLIVDAVFAETSIAFPDAASCSHFVETLGLDHVPMSRDALWLAGQAYKLYRSRGGTRTNVLADFFVGAAAAAAGVSGADPRPEPFLGLLSGRAHDHAGADALSAAPADCTPVSARTSCT